MKKIVFLLVCVFTLTACKTSEEQEARKIYMAYFENNLKDPKSLVIYSEEVEKVDGSEYHYMFTVEYGAKNSYGAMGRETVVFEILTGGGGFISSINGEECYLQPHLK